MRRPMIRFSLRSSVASVASSFSFNGRIEAMKITKFLAIVAVLTARACQAEIVVGTSRPDEETFYLIQDLVNIVTSCYKGQINHGVGLAGNLPSTLIRRLTVQHSIPVALIDNVWNFEDKVRPADLQFRQKLNVFIIKATSFKKLETLIEMNIRKSIWWNNMASFFIFDLSPGCLNAVQYICGAWQNDLLNANMMCRHENRSIIFNYNPFTSQAPVPWKLFKVYPMCPKRKDISHPFTVFSQMYRENEDVCVNLDFKKTQDLGGYTIRLGGIPEATVDFRERGTYAFATTRQRILATVFHALNATTRFHPAGENRYLGKNDHMSNRQVWLLYSWQIDGTMVTYPHTLAEDRIVTQFRGYRSQLNKVVDIFDNGSLIGLLVVYLITLIFFKFFVRQSLAQAVLNLIRMTFGMGFTNLPDNTALRTYLASLLFFAVVMQGLFQSDTASLLTSQVPLPHANSIKDLEDLGYKQICSAPSKTTLLVGSALENKFYGYWDVYNCIISVKNDSSVACIHDLQGVIFDGVKKFDLRVSTKSIGSYYLTFPIQWDYPVTGRINKIIARMVEANVLERWDVKCNPVTVSDFYVDSTDKNNLEFEILNLHDLTFAFAVLGIGLLSATLVFIIELAVGYYNGRYTCGIKIWCHMVPAPRADSIPTLTELR